MRSHDFKVSEINNRGDACQDARQALRDSVEETDSFLSDGIIQILTTVVNEFKWWWWVGSKAKNNAKAELSAACLLYLPGLE